VNGLCGSGTSVCSGLASAGTKRLLSVLANRLLTHKFQFIFL